MRLTDSFKPGVERLEVELDAMVGCGLEFVGVEVLDDALLPAGPDRLLSSLTASEHLNVHHMVLLLTTLGVEIYSTVEDEDV